MRELKQRGTTIRASDLDVHGNLKLDEPFIYGFCEWEWNEDYFYDEDDFKTASIEELEKMYKSNTIALKNTIATNQAYMTQMLNQAFNFAQAEEYQKASDSFYVLADWATNMSERMCACAEGF